MKKTALVLTFCCSTIHAAGEEGTGNQPQSQSADVAAAQCQALLNDQQAQALYQQCLQSLQTNTQNQED